MNRKEFMALLAALLRDIPEEERTEALAYYDGYFEDAGVENEQKILTELESPEKVAMMIKADVGASNAMEYTENGYQDQRFNKRNEVSGWQSNEHSHTDSNYQKDTYHTTNNQQWGKGNNKMLLIILAIVTCPIWLSLVGAVIGAVFGVIGAVFAVLVTAGALTAVCYVTGFVLSGIGIGMLISGTAGIGLGLVGSGMVMIALALLGTLICIVLYGKVTPAVFRFIIRICRKPFQSRGSTA